MARHSVAVGRVLWWAQNWAQLNQLAMFPTATTIGAEFAPGPSCPALNDGDGGGMSGGSGFIFF
jgi:hypothetical protein